MTQSFVALVGGFIRDKMPICIPHLFYEANMHNTVGVS